MKSYGYRTGIGVTVSDEAAPKEVQPPAEVKPAKILFKNVAVKRCPKHGARCTMPCVQCRTEEHINATRKVASSKPTSSSV